MSKSTGSIAETYLAQLAQTFQKVDYSSFTAVLDCIRKVHETDGTILTCGNGGSAANASHLTLHLAQTGYKSFCLNDNIPTLTAIANDQSFAHIFSSFLEKSAQPQDILFILSGSGNSLDLINAMFGRPNTIIAFLGMGGGKIKKVLDWFHNPAAGHYGYSVVVDSMEYGPIEDTHSAWIHILQKSLRSHG